MTTIRPSFAPALAAMKRVSDASKVLSNPTYLALTGDAKKHADEIIAFAVNNPRGDYYLSKLLLLLNTPDNPPATTASALNGELDEAVAKEKRAKKSTAVLGEEERISGQAGRVYETLTNRHWNKTFLVDRRNPKDIVVKVKVRVDAAPAMRQKVHAVEDAIEKHLRIKGLVVDLEFVDSDGPDVFTVKADPTKWTTESNWVGTATGLAHELGHIMGLEDEYDYIESHAANRDMKMETRLYWFTVEMKRRLPQDGPIGMMSNHDNKPLDRHACEIAQLEADKCVTQRTGKPYAKFGPAAGSAPHLMPPAPMLRRSGVTLRQQSVHR